MNTVAYQPNRWKLEDENGDVINYFTSNKKAYAEYALFDADKREITLYSCFEDDDEEMDEWEVEERNY